MKSSHFRVILGALLLVMGTVALLQNFHVLQFSGSLWGIFWAVIFMAGGVAFLTVFFNNRQNWWAVIPGLTLVGLGAITAISILFPDFPGNITGAIFLASIGAAFWVIYFRMPDNWWAIIPGGTLVTLAVVSVAADYNGELSGGLFFMSPLDCWLFFHPQR
jgi:peptidoglycan/LPS O-acetylase OafA/YrhL